MEFYSFEGVLDSGTDLGDWVEVVNTTVNLPDDGNTRMTLEFSIDLDMDDGDVHWEQDVVINETTTVYNTIQDRQRGDAAYDPHLTTIPSFFDMAKATGTFPIRVTMKRQGGGGALVVRYWRVLITTY